jgi:PilZ domain
MREIGRIGRRRSLAATARTYSGDFPRGQVARTGLFGARAGAGQGRGHAEKSASFSQRFLKPDAVGLDRRDDGHGPLTPKARGAQSLYQPGWITLEGGFAARPCVVRDLSSSGAKLTIEDPNTLPAKLRLAFSRDARNGRPCEVVWRRGQTVGIKFVR